MAFIQEDVDKDDAAVGGQDGEIPFRDWVNGQAQDLGVLVQTDCLTLTLLLVVDLL